MAIFARAPQYECRAVGKRNHLLAGSLAGTGSQGVHYAGLTGVFIPIALG
jgi:hypothetical protein